MKVTLTIYMTLRILLPNLMQGNLAGGPASFGQVLQLGHWGNTCLYFHHHDDPNLDIRNKNRCHLRASSTHHFKAFSNPCNTDVMSGYFC